MVVTSPDRCVDDNEACSYLFDREAVVDAEEDGVGGGDDNDDRCSSSSFSAGLDGSEKNKMELVSFLSEELVIADAVKESSPVIPIRQQVRTTANANPTRFFLWFVVVKKSTLLCLCLCLTYI